jgi:hypothetical protein
MIHSSFCIFPKKKSETDRTGKFCWSCCGPAENMVYFSIMDPDLDRHQNSESDPDLDRNQNDAHPQH